MNLIFKNKRISSIVSVLPKHVARYEDELNDYNFPPMQSKRLGMMMDYRTRRECEPTDCISDYALQGINHLVEKGILNKNDIDAIIVVSSSQDYIMPSVSYVLQGRLGLDHDVYCCDILQVCGGYVNGLMQSFMAMDTMGLEKVVLVTGDMLTKKICKRDRNSRPIIGDAVNVSVIENGGGSGKIFVSFRNYGEMSDEIKIPAGGFKMPSTLETAVETADSTGNFRALDHFYMDGDGVFQFVMTQVPSMIDEILKDSGSKVNDVDYYLFHQPNKYMVDRLASEMDIPSERIFSNIVGIYGNSSTGTIPLNICHNIPDVVTKRGLRLCLSGFGAGLTCNAMVIDNPPMDYCSIIEYNND